MSAPSFSTRDSPPPPGRSQRSRPKVATPSARSIASTRRACRPESHSRTATRSVTGHAPAGGAWAAAVFAAGFFFFDGFLAFAAFAGLAAGGAPGYAADFQRARGALAGVAFSAGAVAG